MMTRSVMLTFMLRLWGIVVSIMLLGSTWAADSSLDRLYRVEVVEIPAGDIQLGGLLYTDDSESVMPRPAVVVLHGWLPPGHHGAGTVSTIAHRFQQSGYTALALSMRGWPPSGGIDDCGLRQSHDVLAVLDWLSRRPDVDSDAMTLLGYSQGGQVALLAAARGAGVRAVVAYAPVTVLSSWRETTHMPGIVDYVNDVCSADRGLAPRSPLHAVQTINVPVLLVHGDRDKRVPLEHSRLMWQALEAAGKEATLEIIEGVGHHLGAVEFLTPAFRFLHHRLNVPQTSSDSPGLFTQ